jgi:hypothetical protein
MADQLGEKARRKAARALVGDYHERELTALLERARAISPSSIALRNGTGPTVDPVCLEGALPRRAGRVSA